MEWNIDRRLAIAGVLVGVAVGLIGVGITILFPEVKGLGWTFLFLGCAVFLLWLVFEIKQLMGKTGLSMITAIFVGSVIGGGLAFLFWKAGITINKSQHETNASGNSVSTFHPSITAEVHIPPDPTPKTPVSHPSHKAHPAPAVPTSKPIQRPLLYMTKIELAEDEQLARVTFRNESDFPALDTTTQIRW